ncbi:hypothetical protein HCR_17700 [Hydrogenimonas cancrithermarum]|uniref:General secretion pathway protein C n=1 Tax=Hydrogenimonas cancrithermarum TaxID=2993563 RepID=A0ABM8FM75_9BACT|nr:hypothetical protein HCR_17700 [Hydrogenimonas cancrithermarum]
MLAAKLAALTVDVFLPPTASLECRATVEQPTGRYPFAHAFALRKKDATRRVKPHNKPPATLKGYTLTMTAVGSPSMAIVLHNGKSKLLTVGETIDGFELAEVFTDRIKLLKNGREYWLTMKKTKSGSLSTSRSKKKSGNETAALTEQIRQEGDTYYVPRELLDEMRDVKKIFKYIAINPVYKANKLVGFGITNVKKGSVFDKMGLRKRDIIEKIDGKPITNEGDAFKYFNKINELSTLSLTIKRGSQRKELHYEIY